MFMLTLAYFALCNVERSVLQRRNRDAVCCLYLDIINSRAW